MPESKPVTFERAESVGALRRLAIARIRAERMAAAEKQDPKAFKRFRGSHA